MKQQDDHSEIIGLLAQWIVEIKIHNANTSYDINTKSEDLACSLLNEIYDYQLVNLNTKKHNFPGIDLGDEAKSLLAFQITSRTDSSKIIESLKIFVNNNYDKRFQNGIRFLILSEEKVKLGRKNPKAIYPAFNKEKHIITIKELSKDILTLYNTNYNKFNAIKKILKFELSKKQLKKVNLKKPDAWVRSVWPSNIFDK